MKLVIILPEYRDLAGPLFEQSSHMGAKQSTWSNGASDHFFMVSSRFLQARDAWTNPVTVNDQIMPQ